MHLYMAIWASQLHKAKNIRTYLQAQCTDNQQFFKNSEEAEFLAALCLVLSIFIVAKPLLRPWVRASLSEAPPKLFAPKGEKLNQLR